MFGRNIIVAGNYHQAVNFARENGWSPNSYVYADDHWRLKGLRGDVRIDYVGTWKEHPNIVAIRGEIAVIKGKR